MKRATVKVAAAIAFAALIGDANSEPAHASGGSPLIAGVHHVAITVSDIDTTVAFYRKAVPYEVVRRYKVKGSSFGRQLLTQRHAEVEVALIATPTLLIQLLDFDPRRPSAPNARAVIGPGYTHICFQSPANDSIYTKFRAAGLQMVSRGDAPVDIGGYGVRYAYGRDPDGIMIETEIVDRPKRSEPAWITHIANVVNDRDALLAFYARMLGYPPYRTIEQENRPRLDDIANIDNLAIKGGWFSAGSIDIEIWEYARPRTPVADKARKLDEIGYSAIGFEVADLGQARARLQKLGVRLAGRAMEIGGARVQYAYDPFGSLFSVQEPAPARAE
jgi:catechol 2,3-dioxygenase-like lactoylglutathione lyase family enzyme